MAGGSVVSHLFFHTGGGQIVSRGQLKYSLLRTMEKGEGQLHQFSVVHQVKSVSRGRKSYEVRKSIIQNMRELRFRLNTLIVFICMLQKTPSLIYKNFLLKSVWSFLNYFTLSPFLAGFCLLPLCRCQNNALSFLILYQYQTLFSGVSSEYTSRLSTLEIIIPRSLTGREKHPPFSQEVCYSDFLFFWLLLFFKTLSYITHTYKGWYWEISVMKCASLSLLILSVFN